MIVDPPSPQIKSGGAQEDLQEFKIWLEQHITRGEPPRDEFEREQILLAGRAREFGIQQQQRRRAESRTLLKRWIFYSGIACVASLIGWYLTL